MLQSKPILVVANPDDSYFVWQCHLYVESCLEAGFEAEQIHILLYKPTWREANPKWDMLRELYPTLNIFLYEDKGVQGYLSVYIPVLRPHILWQHFNRFPELKEKTIIYTDCDILWIKGLDITKFFDDNTNYISEASSYLNHSYLRGKEKDVLHEKAEEFSQIDVVKHLCAIVGISEDVLIKNNNNTGGVQYILKNIDAAFWKKVEEDVIAIRVYLLEVNRLYFKDENSGYQSWCSDLFAVLWNLWLRDQETKVIPELNFAWSTDPIERLDTTTILHNAGIVSEIGNGYPAFYKGKYHHGSNPMEDPYLDVILNNKESQKYCTWFYAKKLKELSHKYNLVY